MSGSEQSWKEATFLKEYTRLINAGTPPMRAKEMATTYAGALPRHVDAWLRRAGL